MMKRKIQIGILVLTMIIAFFCFPQNTQAAQQYVFQFTGDVQTWIPTSYDIQIEVWGASGEDAGDGSMNSSGGSAYSGGDGGLGGYVKTKVHLSSLNPISIYVGENRGNYYDTGGATVTVPGGWGYQQGGNGYLYYRETSTTWSYWNVGSGGGSSAVKQGSIVLATAGGGGGGWDSKASSSRNGGNGGGPNGGNGATSSSGTPGPNGTSHGRNGFDGGAAAISSGVDTVIQSGVNYRHGKVIITVLNAAPPVINVIAPSQNSAFGASTSILTPSISVSDADNSGLTCKYYVDSEVNPRDTKIISNTATAQVVSFTPLDTGLLTQGVHSLKFEVSDGDHTVYSTAIIIADRENPVLGVVNVSSDATSITVSGSATDSLSGLDAAPYLIEINGVSGTWGSSPSKTMTGLNANTLYGVKFKAKDRAGNITEAGYNIYTKAVNPVLTADEYGETSLRLVATDANPAGTKYLISCGTQYVSSSGTLTSTPEWIALTNKKITVTGLTQNTLYTFAVKAQNGDGAETGTFNMSAVTLAAPPTALSFSEITQTSLRVSWPAVNGATGYDVEADGNIINNGLNNSFVHTGLTSSSVHTYRVRVRNSSGTGYWGNPSSCTTLIDKPGIPGNVTAVPGKRLITVSWNQVPAATGYDIEIDGTVQDNGTAISYVHNNIEPDSVHKYRVRAKNAGGSGEWSGYVDAVAFPMPPQPPEDIAAELTKTSIALSWAEVPKTDRYEIEVDGFVYNNGSTASYLHSNLVPLSEHKYRIRGTNAGGVGEWSEYFTFMTHPYEPAMPENVMASANMDSISLSWYASAFAEYYEVEINGSETARVPDTGFEQTGLESGVAQTYRVRAGNISGVSQWTQPLTISTSPAGESAGSSVTNTTAVVTTDTITLSWDAEAYLCEYEVEADGKLINNGFNTVFSHTGLEPGSYHNYKIRVKRPEGQGEWSTVLSLSTLPLPPGAPRITKTFAANNTIQIWWDAIEEALSYDVEVDGKVLANTADITFLHENLLPGTTHQYRVRARTMTDVSPWSEVAEVTTRTTLYEVDCVEGEEFDFSLLAVNVQDFTGEKFVVLFDSSRLEVVDLCTFTPESDTMGGGDIPGTNLSVTQQDGRLEFKVNESLAPGTCWSGEITAVRFRAKVGGLTYLDYREEK